MKWKKRKIFMGGIFVGTLLKTAAKTAELNDDDALKILMIFALFFCGCCHFGSVFLLKK